MHASKRAIREAEIALKSIAAPDALTTLLPYILDPHGPGSRLSVRRRPETREARIRKRAEGIFYTPADVAAYMVDEALRDLQKGSHPITVFDPACGTGVFLRAALQTLRKQALQAKPLDIACSCLYGADIDPWALDATAFVLLRACFADVAEREIAPLAAWHSLRLNLANVDTLLLDPAKAAPRPNERIDRLDCRARLKAGFIPERSDSVLPAGRLSFSQLFPEVAEGPRVIVGNPPYADLGSNFMELRGIFATVDASPRASADIYPLFVEQMVRLTAPDAHGGALVLPLSIACNSGPQFAATRSLLAKTEGTWRFAFFDREPHALFGEDVKTRNAIVLWTKQAGEKKTKILTGPLRKWRGDGRAAMFKNISFTVIGAGIRQGIPKVEGEDQARALTRLSMKDKLLEDVVLGLGRSTLEETTLSDERTVHVGSTAYNFLSVFLKPHINGQGRYPLSENPCHALACKSSKDSFALFAALSGRLAFWWWHIHGDGFHVIRRTLEKLPIGEVLLNKQYLNSLAELGKTLWKVLSSQPIVSVNRGRMSLGFSAAPQRNIRMQIDQLLIEALGLESAFATTLERFTDRVTTVPTEDA